MIPWRFAYDRNNCAPYLPLYLKSTISLSTSYPQVNDYLQKDGLSVQLGSVNKSGRIPMGQATEETANREIKALKGTKGFSARTRVVARYSLTPEYIRAYIYITSVNCGI